MKWGIYDVVDRCWLGDKAGPKVFDTDAVVNGKALGDGAQTFARAAAHIAAIRLGVSRHRIIAKVYGGSGTKLKDELPVKDTTRNVLRKLEDGTIV